MQGGRKSERTDREGEELERQYKGQKGRTVT